MGWQGRSGCNGRGSLSLDIGCVMPIGKLRRLCVVVFGPCLSPTRALPWIVVAHRGTPLESRLRHRSCPPISLMFPSVGTPGPGYASTYGTFALSVPLVESLQLRKLIRLPCLHYSVYLLTALQNDSGRVRARPPAPLPCCFPMPVSCV